LMLKQEYTLIFVLKPFRASINNFNHLVSSSC
jgi:hypothetical protein